LAWSFKDRAEVVGLSSLVKEAQVETEAGPQNAAAARELSHHPTNSFAAPKSQLIFFPTEGPTGRDIKAQGKALGTRILRRVAP
jgi:hypothetical protein